MHSRLHTCGALAALLLASACSGNPDSDENTEAETATSATTSSSLAATSQAAAAPPVAFARCRSCHSVEPGRNGLGPSLHGVFGKKSASIENYNFSPALKKANLTWDRATLDEWLSAPSKKVPGTRMMLSMPDDEQRKAIIDYLESLK